MRGYPAVCASFDGEMSLNGELIIEDGVLVLSSKETYFFDERLITLLCTSVKIY